MSDRETASANANAPMALEVREISKSFEGVRVLGPVDLDVKAGEVHALLGHNGSGKSTLIKVLSGYHAPDTGEVFVAGERMSTGSPAASHASGCRFVHQDLALVGALSVLDNVSCGSGYPTFLGTIDRRAARRRVVEVLERVGLDVDPRSPVSELSAAEQTGVAIARAFGLDESSPTRVLVLDEPTAMLPKNEVEHLHGMLRTAIDAGVGILYVTHHLDEVFAIAKNVTVLRDGRVAVTSDTRDISRTALVDHLTGHQALAVGTTPTQLATHPHNVAPVLVVDRLTTKQIAGMSFSARSGEVVGFHGLTGSGRDRILGAVFGALERSSGTVQIAGKSIPPDRPDRSIRAGVGYLPPDRKTTGGIMEMSAAENVTLSDLRPFWRHLWLRKEPELQEAEKWLLTLGVRPSGAAKSKLATFSGGNQQKILLARLLRIKPRVLLLDDPTQGVDVAAKAEIHRQILDAAAGGTAVVVSSNDEDELSSICTRLLVVRDGGIVDELSGHEITYATVRTSLYRTAHGTHSTPNVEALA